MVTFKKIDLSDTRKAEELFEKKAAEGYYVKRVGNLCQEYKKGEPGKVKYFIEFSHKKPDEEKKELYRQAGWEFAAFGEMMCIWYSKNTDAVEPHTDRAVYGEMIKPVYSRLVLIVMACAFFIFEYVYCLAVYLSDYILTLTMMQFYKIGNFLNDYTYRTLFWENSSYSVNSALCISILCMTGFVIFELILYMQNCIKLKNKLNELCGGGFKSTAVHKTGLAISGMVVLAAAVVLCMALFNPGGTTSDKATGAAEVGQLINRSGGTVTAEELITDDYPLDTDNVEFKMINTAFGKCAEYIAFIPTSDIYMNDFQTGEKMKSRFYVHTTHYYADKEKNAVAVYDEIIRDFETRYSADEYQYENVHTESFDRFVYCTSKIVTPHYNEAGENVDMYVHYIWLLKDGNAAEYSFHSLERSENCQQIVDNIEEKWSEISA